ncbi:erythropoietin-like [Hemicordylus capensis]|uniref:erythropoietin-like n=1 Tax=Hemicordylus capensis TaxID=884348 RepID=UPI0023027B2B|nr:erythropoietin-like [Hemicordylus capensis]
MELNRLLLFTTFLLHIKPSRMSPMGLICDQRLIQKYVLEAVALEDKVSHCGELPLLQQPVHLPLVGFNPRDWMAKTNQAKGLEVLRDLAKLVDGTAAAQRGLQPGCAFALLQQLYEKASTFLLQLRNFEWQEQDSTRQPEEDSQLIPERNLRTIFQTYKQLVRGKLRLLFHDLWKDSCGGDHG